MLDSLWQRYNRLKLAGAMHDNFNFQADFEAYEAYANGNPEKLEELIKLRKSEIGNVKTLTKNQFVEAQSKYYAKPRGRALEFAYPSKLVKTTKTEAIYE